MEYPARILIADDDDGIRFTLQQVLKKEGAEICLAADGEEAVRASREKDFDLAILDYKMPRLNGIEAMQQIKRLAPEMLVLMMTAYGSRDLALDAMRNGAHDYFSKPFDIDELRIVVKRALDRQSMRRQIEQLRMRLSDQARFDRIIGASSTMQEVFSLLRRVCMSEVTVLIHGESGTGKELIAQATHFNSERRDAAFVSINCAAIPENLLESELFGHERGAFTGAIAQKPGRFEIASGGTIFLDEIGDMPLTLQAKMLRVLQERVIERVGGTKPVAVDVRVVAATNRNLESMVTRGEFREDLFFRLNVVPIHLPPLREREGDIMLLADHFLRHYNLKFGRRVEGFTGEASESLMHYAWPGNVRELENAVQRAVILSTGTTITRNDLPPNVYQNEPTENLKLPSEDNFDIPLAEKIAAISDRYEKAYILAALQKAKYHRQDTADLLGISRKSLHNKMQKFELFGSDEEREYRGTNGDDS